MKTGITQTDYFLVTIVIFVSLYIGVAGAGSLRAGSKTSFSVYGSQTDDSLSRKNGSG